MGTGIIEVSGLVKKFGDLTAVDGVSFQIEEGEIFGLLGPNGAGKTTTISILSCLLAPSGGRVTVAGMDVVTDANGVKKIIGIVPQDIALYPTLSARDNLSFFGHICGLSGKELKEKMELALEIVGLK